MTEELKTLNAMQITIEILSDALEDCYAIAKANPMHTSSLAIKQTADKAIRKALTVMEQHGQD